MAGKLEIACMLLVLTFGIVSAKKSTCDKAYMSLQFAECLTESKNLQKIGDEFATIRWAELRNAITMERERVEDALKTSQSVKMDDIYGNLAFPLLMNAQLKPDSLDKQWGVWGEKNAPAICNALLESAKCFVKLTKGCKDEVHTVIEMLLGLAPTELLGFNLKSYANEEIISDFIKRIADDLLDMLPDRCPVELFDKYLSVIGCVEKEGGEAGTECLKQIDNETVKEEIESRLSISTAYLFFSMKVEPPKEHKDDFHDVLQCIAKPVDKNCKLDKHLSFIPFYPFIKSYILGRF